MYMLPLTYIIHIYVCICRYPNIIQFLVIPAIFSNLEPTAFGHRIGTQQKCLRDPFILICRGICISVGNGRKKKMKTYTDVTPWAIMVRVNTHGVYVRDNLHKYNNIFSLFFNRKLHVFFFRMLQSLSGFLMMMTQNGKLLYISDNAAEYLGHSMVSNTYHTYI